MPDPISNRFKMSQERLDSIKEELQYLETVREKEVAELIKEARSFGDLSENSEYDEAKTEQGKILIENAVIVDNLETDVPKDAVTLGSVVRVRDLEDDFEAEYEIVGSQEANPREGRISDDSPLFQALKGRRKGETVLVNAPAGVFKYEILSVSND